MHKLIIAFVVCCFFAEGFVYKPPKQDAEVDPEYYDITEKNLTFLLFTRQNKQTGVVLTFGDKTKLLASGFKGSKPTKMCTHGFLSHGKVGFIMDMKNQLLSKEDINFISLDWSPCAKNLRYDQVVRCMKTAAEYTGKFLQFLQKEGKLSPSNMHLIGHSLGAHLMGFASKSFGPPSTIGRISGLDPAGPLFESAQESQRLNPKSAKFVDVIHTCRIFTGIKKPVGTVDFYPNGGFDQPGCHKLDLPCHHKSSHSLFIKSIASKTAYQAKKCNTLGNAINGTCSGIQGVMGYHSTKTSPGIYYLKVTA